MKQIPLQYFKSQDTEALMKMRQWMNRKDLSVSDISSQLTKRYRRAKNDDERFYIGRLLACAYAHRNNELASRVADMFGLTTNGLTVGESVLLQALHGNLKWHRNFNRETLLASCPVPMSVKLPGGIVPDADRTVILITDDIYLTRITGGIPQLFIVNETTADTLIDEERFEQEAPLYFTESSHFVSPVYKLKLYHYILDFLLDEIGYSPMKIKNHVIFAKANLVNYKDYAEGDFVMQWSDVNVIMLNEFKQPHVFPDAMPIPAEIYPDALMHNAFMQAVRAAAIIYNSFMKDDFSDEPTETSLRRAANKLKIFQPTHRELF